MSKEFSRRQMLLASAGALAFTRGAQLFAQHLPKPALELPPPPIIPVKGRSAVSIVRGVNRRQAIHDSLVGIDREMVLGLKRKKYVVIKVNFTATTNQLASTHRDAVAGILDYLGPRFKGPVVIGEAASNDTMAGFDNFNFSELVKDFKSQKVSLVDFNQEQYALMQSIDVNIHPQPVRIAARLVDADAFVIDCCIPKTHNAVIYTGAVKNMSMGAPLRSPIKETPVWSDKRKIHVNGHWQHNYNLFLVAQHLAPYWGATVLDGFEAMEGDGPIYGNKVDWKIAMASTDYIAGDRVALEAMGMDPKWIGYLEYCGQMGIGNYDLANIDVRGEKLEAVKQTFKLPGTVDDQLKWMGPLEITPERTPQQRRPGGAQPAPAAAPPTSGGIG
jgi:uncharacterized protein (DUF362 family)